MPTKLTNLQYTKSLNSNALIFLVVVLPLVHSRNNTRCVYNKLIYSFARYCVIQNDVALEITT